MQRTNSRMILVWTPYPDNLIQSDIERCKRSVTLRKEKAIQSLHLEKLQPQRIMDMNGVKLSRNKMVGSLRNSPLLKKLMSSQGNLNSLKEAVLLLRNYQNPNYVKNAKLLKSHCQ